LEDISSFKEKIKNILKVEAKDFELVDKTKELIYKKKSFFIDDSCLLGILKQILKLDNNMKRMIKSAGYWGSGRGLRILKEPESIKDTFSAFFPVLHEKVNKEFSNLIKDFKKNYNYELFYEKSLKDLKKRFKNILESVEDYESALNKINPKRVVKLKSYIGNFLATEKSMKEKFSLLHEIN